MKLSYNVPLLRFLRILTLKMPGKSIDHVRFLSIILRICTALTYSLGENESLSRSNHLSVCYLY